MRALFDLVVKPSQSDVLTQVVRAAAELAGTSDAVLAVRDEADEVTEVVHTDGSSTGAAWARLVSRSAPGRPSSPHLGHNHLPPQPSGAPEAYVGIPIRSRRGFRADLFLPNADDGDVFGEDDQELLDAFASVAGALIDKAQLDEEAQRRELWVALQGEIATSLLAGAAIEEVMDSVARGARELTDADAAAVTLYDSGSSLRVCAADGRGVRQLVGDSIAMENTVSGEVIRTGEPAVLVDTASFGPRREPLLSLEVFGRALVVPLLPTGRTAGTLAVGRALDRPPMTQTDFWLLDSFASQVSMALEYGRARHELERLAVVEDQERIARDLHDTVIQQLFATGMSLQATAQRTTDSRTADRIQTAIDSLDAVIRDIRAAVFALRSTGSGSSAGIRVTLADIAAQIFEHTAVTVRLEFDGPVDTAVSDEIKQHLVATVREGLSNVNRHAQAREVEVTVKAGADLLLRIVDDGVGIGPDAKPRSGLLNLSARARGLGGSMVLSRASPGGTTLEWRVPWEKHGSETANP